MTGESFVGHCEGLFVYKCDMGNGEAQQAAVAEIAPAMAEVIEGNLRCNGCGYNLRTLGKEARCPECGALVAVSLAKKTFASEETSWLVRMAIGLGMLVVGSVLVLTGVLASEIYKVDRIAETGLSIGPAGLTMWPLADVLRRTQARTIGLLALALHSVGVFMVAGGSRTDRINIWRMMLLAITAATVAGGIALVVRRHFVIIGRLSYDDVLKWVVLVDCVGAVLLNVRIFGIAQRGGSDWSEMGIVMAFTVQAVAILMLVGDMANIFDPDAPVMAAIFYGIGGGALTVLVLWMCGKMVMELQRRRGADVR